jgi:metal-responsive CopG/Arc/MetJ family transcriptional regulator
MTLVILSFMKTAVSIPDHIFKEAERAARRLRITRSELYAKALRIYLDSGRGEAVTEALNNIYSAEKSGLDEALARMQFVSLAKEDW